MTNVDNLISLSEFKLVLTQIFLLLVFMLLNQPLFSSSLNRVYPGQEQSALAFSSSKTDNPKLTVKFKNKPLESAIQTIARKAEVGISYKKRNLPNKLVTYKAVNTPIFEVLKGVLKDTGLYATLSGNREVIIIKKAEPVMQEVQTGTITGTVTDAETGEPLIGANVYIEALGSGAATNTEGEFRIEDVEAGTYTLRVSYVGYKEQEKEVMVAANEVTIVTFSLEAGSTALEEVVVTGTLARTTRKELATPVSIITENEIEEFNPVRLTDLFEGQIPGVFSLNSGGGSFQRQQITIRGNVGLVPNVLILVDGIKVHPQALSTISAHNIKRIEVVRGAQATTIYGSRAAGGVIHIITEKGGGAAGERLEVATTFGVTNTAYVNDTPLFQEYSLALGGDLGEGSYHLGASYTNEEGFIPHQDRSTLSFSSGLQRQFGDFDLSFITRFTKDDLEFPTYASVFYNLHQANVLPDIYSTLYGNDSGVERNLTLGFKVDYNPFKWWSHHLTLGTNLVHIKYPFPPGPAEADSIGAYTTYKYTSPSVRYYTSVQFEPDTDFIVTLATGFDWGRRDQFVQRNEYIYSNSGAKNYLGGYARDRTDTNSGVFGELRLGIFEHLFATVGLRFDHHSNFGEEFGNWVTSPRVGLTYSNEIAEGWIIKPHLSWGQGVTAPSSRMVNGAPPTMLPNPEIGPQRTTGWEAGLSQYFFDGRLFVEATYYHQLTEDAFNGAYVEFPVTQIFINAGEILNEGFEFKIGWNRDPLKTTFTLSTNHNEWISLPDTAQIGTVGKPILTPPIPKLTSALQASYSLDQQLNLPANVGFLIQYIGERYTQDNGAYFADVKNGTVKGPPTEYARWFEGLTKMNVWIGYDFTQQFSAELRVKNAFNNLESETPYYVVSGRQVLFSIRAHF